MTIITSSRLSMRKWTRDDLDLKDMVRWLNDPEVVRYSEQRHKVHTEETQKFYLNDVPDVFRQIYLEDKFIGTITAYIDQPNSVADVGILIGERKEWGNGYGKEAWEAFCDSLFKAGIRKIEAGCMSTNTAMRRICTWYNMDEEGRRPGHFRSSDRGFVDMMMFGKFNEAV